MLYQSQPRFVNEKPGSGASGRAAAITPELSALPATSQTSFGAQDSATFHALGRLPVSRTLEPTIHTTLLRSLLLSSEKESFQHFSSCYKNAARLRAAFFVRVVINFLCLRASDFKCPAACLTINPEIKNMNDVEKLKHLLSHWLEHNSEHAGTYRDWSERMKKQGREDLAELLERIARETGKVDDLFKKARSLMD